MTGSRACLWARSAEEVLVCFPGERYPQLASLCGKKKKENKELIGFLG
jgi:hypothetical protein